MRIPSKINILGSVIHVKRVNNWNDHKELKNPEWLVGLFKPSTMTIYILKDKSQDLQEKFFLHELNHAIMYITGVSQTISDAMEEVVAQSFAMVYSDLINKRVLND